MTELQPLFDAAGLALMHTPDFWADDMIGLVRGCSIAVGRCLCGRYEAAFGERTGPIACPDAR